LGDTEFSGMRGGRPAGSVPLSHGHPRPLKVVDTPDYHLIFDPATGFMARWGRTRDEDPRMSPLGPEIADIEISTVCHGIGTSVEGRRPCAWCYKSNTGEGESMSLATFERVLLRLDPRDNLTQVALGIGDLDGNPELYSIMEHCRGMGVVPNITTNGMGIDDTVFGSFTHAELLAKTCGAVAVSHYGIDDVCFDAVRSLSDHGLRQVNIHKLLSKQTLQSCIDLIDKTRTDPRLRGLKAIVFLLLKPKGERNTLGPVTMTEYRSLIDYAHGFGVPIGMDSCSAPMALKTLPAEFRQSIEPCESALFSIYANVRGEMFPCSFAEGTPGWESGIPLDGPPTQDDLEAVWNHPRLVEWRRRLLGSSDGCPDCETRPHCRSCPIYDITLCKTDGLVQIGGAGR